MPNFYQATNINPIQFVTPTSRYIDSTVAYYTDRKLLTFSIYKRNTYPPTSTDKYTVINKRYEYRPDLVSYDAYGTVDFWWKIMEANGIFDIYSFKAGLNIRIPGNIFG